MMTIHYIITVPVIDEDVEVMQRELSDYMKTHRGFSLHVETENENPPSVELQTAIQNLFAHMIVTIVHNGFERIH